MKLQLLTIATALVITAPAIHGQATSIPLSPPPGHMGARHQNGGIIKSLNLSTAQTAQIEAIHSRYETQMRAARSGVKPDMESVKSARSSGNKELMRAERRKIQAERTPMIRIREQEMAEVRAVLTVDQQKKFDASAARMKMHRRESRDDR